MKNLVITLLAFGVVGLFVLMVIKQNSVCDLKNRLANSGYKISASVSQEFGLEKCN